jgi:hypothetical protein
MLKQALICATLITCGTILALNAKAPADVGLDSQPAMPLAALSSAPNLPETQIVDYTFVFIEGDSDVAIRASTR